MGASSVVPAGAAYVSCSCAPSGHETPTPASVRVRVGNGGGVSARAGVLFDPTRIDEARRVNPAAQAVVVRTHGMIDHMDAGWGHSMENEELLTRSCRPGWDRVVGSAEVMFMTLALEICLARQLSVFLLMFLVAAAVHAALGMLWLRTWWWWPLAGLLAYGLVTPVVALVAFSGSGLSERTAILALSLALLMPWSFGQLGQLIIRASQGIPTRHPFRHALATGMVLVLLAGWGLWWRDGL
mgnify:FL=1